MNESARAIVIAVAAASAGALVSGLITHWLTRERTIESVAKGTTPLPLNATPTTTGSTPIVATPTSSSTATPTTTPQVSTTDTSPPEVQPQPKPKIQPKVPKEGLDELLQIAQIAQAAMPMESYGASYWGL